MRRLLALALTGAAAVATSATAGPAGAADWPPADLRAYVQSGQYLTDVETATVPARQWLVARTDAIAAQTELCRAAMLPVGTGGARSAPRGATAASVPTTSWATSVLRAGPTETGSRGGGVWRVGAGA